MGATPAWRRLSAELGLLLAAGLFMGAIGPFGTAELPESQRYPYWLACIAGGGVIGIAIDAALVKILPAPWPRTLAASLVMSPAVTLLVMALGLALLGQPTHWTEFPTLLGQVFIISLAVMAARTLAQRRPETVVETVVETVIERQTVVERETVVETRTVVAPPLPEAEAAFRARLSAKRRGARLIAVEAHDHYLRVHTDAGVELLTLRFADALAELAVAHGLRTHRSWWVAAGAIEAVDRRRGAASVRLTGGLEAPVSRTYAPALREAGWF